MGRCLGLGAINQIHADNLNYDNVNRDRHKSISPSGKTTVAGSGKKSLSKVFRLAMMIVRTENDDSLKAKTTKICNDVEYH